MWKGFVWGNNGYLKLLVYEKKFLPEDKISGRQAGYYDCIRIEEPRAKAKVND